MCSAKVRCGLLFGALVVIASVARANAGPPRPPVRETDSSRVSVPVVIEQKELGERDRDAKAVVKIPRNLLPKLVGKEDAPDTKTTPPGAKAAPSGDAPPKVEKQTSAPYGGTLVAGLAMSLCAVSLVFVLKRGGSTRTASVLLLVVGLAGLTACTVLADLRVPGQPYRGPARRPDDRPIPADRITIEIVDEGSAVTLTLAPEKKPK